MILCTKCLSWGLMPTHVKRMPSKESVNQLVMFPDGVASGVMGRCRSGV